MSDLRRRRSRSDQRAGWLGQQKAFAQLASQQLGLVEPPLSQPRAVERYRDRPWRGQPLHDQPLGQQKRQRLGKVFPPVVLEALQRDLDWTFIGHS